MKSCIFFNILKPRYVKLYIVIMNGILKITTQNWLLLIILNIIDTSKC